MKIKYLFCLIVLLSTILQTGAQEKIMLYPNGSIENNELKEAESHRYADFVVNVSEARMIAYIVPKALASGAAVVICPGGAYVGLSEINEGEEIAKWFNKQGISAFVLYYRMPNGHWNIPLTDAQTAFAIVRKRAKEYNINPNKIGIIGFSAGGHLASTVGTHFKNKTERPAFMILGYPVITMDNALTDSLSKVKLLGENPSAELVKRFSNELQVTKHTPPTFIVHAKDDNIVAVANSEYMAKALEAKNVNIKYIEYEKGGHGFGMRKLNLPVDGWPEELAKWLIDKKLTNAH